MTSEPRTAPTHRGTDDSAADWRGERRKFPDIKQTLGSLALILVPFLLAGVIWFAAKDRDGMLQQAQAGIVVGNEAKEMAREAKALAVQALNAQATQAAVANAHMDEIRRRLGDIETNVKVVKRNTQ